MADAFSPKFLIEKLAKLTNSQHSIESLSRWCMFHVKNAKDVVEIWDRQFQSAQNEQQVAFLYLSNDILQISRRYGPEFIIEFLKVLPNAICHVIETGDDFGRNAALRLINIWEERKIFGTRRHILKEMLVGRKWNIEEQNECPPGFELKCSARNMLGNIVSGYHAVYGCQPDEDTLLDKCRNATSCVEEVKKKINCDTRSGELYGSAIMEEIKGQNIILNECIEKLMAIKSSREALVSNLRQALQEQESKLDEVSNELKTLQEQSALTTNMFRQSININCYLPSKRTRFNNDQFTYIRCEKPQTSVAAVPHPVSLAQTISNASRELSRPQGQPLSQQIQPPLSSSPPPMPPPPPKEPYHVPQYMQNADPFPTPGTSTYQSYGTTTGGGFYGQQFSAIPSPPAPRTNFYYQPTTEDDFYVQQSSLPMAPTSWRR